MNFHKNDTKPNIDLVMIIFKELKNIGVTKQLFNEEKLIAETNFVALDYLFKHFNAIEEARKIAVFDVDKIYDLNVVETELRNILNIHIKLIKPGTTEIIGQKIADYFKKLMDKNKVNQDISNDYFELLQNIAIKTKSETMYVQEFEKFFNNTFDENVNVFERLNQLFEAQTSSDYWSEFKNSIANLANNAAWYVVENSKNAETIKKAIKWSETSLFIIKNNYFYLDTLAQLYYRNGEKQKAIATQEKAIEFNTENIEIEKYTTVLEQMKNGTY